MPNHVSANDAAASKPFPIQCPKCSAFAGIAVSVEAGAPDPKARHVKVVCNTCTYCWRVEFHVSD